MRIDAFKVRLLGVCLTCAATFAVADDDMLDDVLSGLDEPAAAKKAEPAAPAAAEPVKEAESVAAAPVKEEGEVAPAEVSTEVAAEGEAAPAGEGDEAKKEEKPIPLLPFARVIRTTGAVSVMNPDVNKAQAPIIGKMYPLGTVFETSPKSSMVIALGDGVIFTLGPNSVASVKAGADPVKSRIVALVSGSVSTAFDEKLPKGVVSIESACVRFRDVCGRSTIEVENGGDGSETLNAMVVTGSSLVEGAQFHVPVLGSADKLSVFTAGNRSLSRIEGVAGNYDLVLSKGAEAPLVYPVTPQSTAKIFREHAKVGGRLLVSVLVANPYGEAVNRFAFAEGRAEVATGELINPKEETEDPNAAPKGADEVPVLDKESVAAEKPAAEKPADAAAATEEISLEE